jgi:hypothetical protein
MRYIITSYCSVYGPSDIFIVDTIEDIYNFVIDYVIYPASIFKNINFKLEDIPTFENIQNKLEQKEYVDDNCNFGAKEIIIYTGSRGVDKYYVTVKIIEDIPRLKLNNNLLKVIQDYKK